MDRRQFFKTGMLFAGALSVDHRLLAKAAKTMGQAKLKIGVLSDVHIRHADQTGTLENALKYFRDRGADGVLIAGDIADAGLSRQLTWVAQTWERVFPKDKAPDGRHVEKLFIYGNHDMEGHNYGNLEDIVSKDKLEQLRKSEALANDRAGYWKKIFKEKFAPIYIKDVKGYKFIGAHWHDWKNIPGLEAFFTAHQKELTGDKPFFYFQHPHPRNTCSGEWAWGMDDGSSTELFTHYPNCIVFSGHSHTILNDDRTIWQGGFTSVGTSSLSYTYALGGRENTYVDGENVQMPSQMPVVNQTDGKQGMFMTVYDKYITLERREFVYNESLGNDWIIPLPFADGPATLSFEYRADRAKAPEFPADSKVTVTRAKGKDRYGKEQMQTTVHFPNVLKKNTGQRAYDFEVQLEMHDVDTYKIMLTKRVMSPHFYLGENKDQDEVTCVFGEAEVPGHREFRFLVRPCECFGKKGSAITSKWMKI